MGVSALLLAACSPKSDVSPTAAFTQSGATAHGVYVALGDSYTAGPGIPDQTGTPSGCGRSTNNYPALVAQAVGTSGTQYDDVSCSGATIANLTAAQDVDGGVNPVQLSALSANDTIVTLGIGGNDVDFAGVLTRCVEMDIAPSLIGSWASDSTPCQAHYSNSGTNQIDQKIQDASERLTAALKQISQRAPHARIYVVGYPDLLPSNGGDCAHTLGITSGDLTFLNQEELRLNAMLDRQARTAGAVYVDTYDPSQGHDACSHADTRWTEPLLPSSAAAPLHPNARGEHGMADAVIAAIKTAG
jgi:lysophospholipase L1-like esterase